MANYTSLQNLRKRIDQIDRNIMRLLDERLTIARGIVNIKEQRRLPVYDQAREQAIIAELQKQARRPELAEAVGRIYEPILALSRSVQAARRREMHRAHQAGIKIGIIGYGRFGSLLADVFRKNWPTARVMVYSRSQVEDNNLFFSLAEVAQADIILPCVPISSLAGTLRDLKPLLRPGAVIIDVCSVKVMPVRWLKEIIGAEAGLIATHPMFGPDSTAYGTQWSGLTMVLYNISAPPKLYESYIAFWQSLGVTTIELTPEEHDYFAAYTLNYSHLLARVAEQMDIRPTPIDTKSFDYLYAAMQCVIHDSWELFSDIQKYNPYAPAMMVQVIDALAVIQKKLSDPGPADTASPAAAKLAAPAGQVLTVSIQGNAGSYHDIVAHDVFSADIKTLERDSFSEVFSDVISGSVAYGVVAIENSIVGSLQDNYDLLLTYDVTVVAERYMRINHHLMVLPGTAWDDVKEVISHSVALKQCQVFLSQHKNWKIIEYPDTAGAAAFIKNKQKKTAAAIASRRAAEVYGMKILQSDIETNKRNYTRFFIIARAPDYPAQADKTSIAFTLKHETGSLVQVLNILASHGINMTKIESRPIVGVEWEYRFFIDFEGGAQAPAVQAALAEIQTFTHWFKILGSYVIQPAIE